MVHLQPRSATALASAVLLVVMWVVSLDQFVVPEPADAVVPAATASRGPPPPTVVIPLPSTRAQRIPLPVTTNAVATLPAEHGDADHDRSKIEALQKALTDCKLRVTQLEAQQSGSKRSLPDHDLRQSSKKIVVPPRSRPKHDAKPVGGRATPTSIVPTAAPKVVNPRPAAKGDIPVVVFTYNRPAQLKRTIAKVLKVLPERGFQLFISQDGDEFPEVKTTVDELRREHSKRNIHHIVHVRDDSGAKPEEIEQGWQAYYAISHHYQSTINKVFASDASFQRVILLEDDIEVAGDFFEYMRATAPLFDQDESLYCVSGFNDNGKPEHVSDPEALYRSDFFPGLGWMTSRLVWKELNAIWPKGFWDDWMRQPDKRKGRSCIRPEVPRSKTDCSEQGVSNCQFSEHLQAMRLSETAVDWTKKDLSYLTLAKYVRYLQNIVDRATPLHTVFEAETLPADAKEAKILYHSNDELVALEQQVDVMTDFKDGVPRTAFRGVISLRFKGKRLHLVASTELYVYD
jgi:alpha-1,3-mannosyl-glycoprotein beta-1,2-N-acetylglucosaminyltransferase